MSDLIKKLFTKATFEEDRVVAGVYHPYIPLQITGEPFRFAVTSDQYHKFAELVIQECINTVITAHRGHINPKITIDSIKTHFGINE